MTGNNPKEMTNETPRHPMATAPIHVFTRSNPDGTGAGSIAKLWPYKSYPMYFKGGNEQEALDAAQEFVDQAVEANEKAYVARKLALEKSKATRAKKQGLKG